MEAVTRRRVGDFELASWPSLCLTVDELSRQLCPLLLTGFFYPEPSNLPVIQR